MLLLVNHTSDIDPVLVQAALPRHVVFMAKEELFRMGLLGAILRVFGAFPVKRGTPDRGALRRASDLIESGRVVCIFPEGKLSKTGELGEIQPGVALIASITNCTVVCARIRGANRILPYGQLLPRPALSWVTISFGNPWRTEGDFVERVRDEILGL
ncbi:MAG: 1-acyl-sn-glycerol-3-phosphate acyltransferase [Chthonomonas sp.]|nr:1-acyl-sn-glycerol-3-phosphate acyltransferase [Chthonomonas sp.]